MKHRFKSKAAQILANRAGDYPHLVRIHTLITISSWSVLLILCYSMLFLYPEGGLSNLNTHSLLFTVQIMILLIGLLLLPLWEVGLHYATLEFIREKHHNRQDLWEGFRCFAPLAGATLYQGFRYILAYLLSNIIAPLILSLLPFSQAFYQDATYLLEHPTMPLKGRMMIVATIVGTVFICILIFLFSQVFYRYRMTDRIILDQEKYGGAKASLESKNILKGHKKQLFLIDLSYWWFHLTNVLGIFLPISLIIFSGLDILISETLKSILLISSVICIIMRLIINCLAKPKIATTYALFYDSLLTQADTASTETTPNNDHPSKKTRDKKSPWQY